MATARASGAIRGQATQLTGGLPSWERSPAKRTSWENFSWNITKRSNDTENHQTNLFSGRMRSGSGWFKKTHFQRLVTKTWNQSGKSIIILPWPVPDGISNSMRIQSKIFNNWKWCIGNKQKGHGYKGFLFFWASVLKCFFSWMFFALVNYFVSFSFKTQNKFVHFHSSVTQ